MVRAAGHKFSNQRIFAALLPHATSIRTLTGSTSCPTEPQFSSTCLATLTRWETFWTCLPNLRSLAWTVPNCGFPKNARRDLPAFGPPASLENLSLSVVWEDGDLPPAPFKLAELMTQGYDQKLNSLKVYAAPESAIYANDILDLDGVFPVLKSLYCSGAGVTGTLTALNLTHVKLILECAPTFRLDWSAFAPCQQLRSIKISMDGHFDCRGCTMPRALEQLWLEVGHLTENMLFVRSSIRLKRMRMTHLAFTVDPRHSFNFTSRQEDAHFSLQQGRLDVWMPCYPSTAWKTAVW